MTKTTVKGAYQVEVFEGGQLIKDTGEFVNLITDLALAESAPFSSGVLCIGEGSTAPTVADISLESELAAKSGAFDYAGTLIMQHGKRYGRRSITVSFDNITGNISEVGFRGDDVNSVRSRTIVRDGNGLATIIPIKPEQTLKITYSVYILIPDVLATGTVTTPYGTSLFTIKPHAGLVSPAGIFAGDFNNPFLGGGLKAILTDGSVNADVFTWTYDTATRTATATVNFNAIDTNRTIVGFVSVSNPVNLPVIELDTPLINPGQNDCSFTLSFTWDRA